MAGFKALIVLDCFVHHVGSATFKNIGVNYKSLLEHNLGLLEEKWGPLIRTNPITVPALPAGDADDMGKRPRLSLCMIVRNSSQTLRACLESIRPWVDEMLIVDTGSTDDTPQIAESLGAIVRHFPWCDSFAEARNVSLASARGQWLFWMDSDDTIDETNGKKLRELVNAAHPASTMGFVLQVHCPVDSARSAYAI